MKLSACMMVKDEEKMLPDCLESIKDVVDEIVLVDTGSTDRTMDIAEEYGARIFKHPWENDFSLHRNQSIEYATGDWIFIIDADERLRFEDRDKIRPFLEATDEDVISIDLYNHYPDSTLVTFMNTYRFFRSSLNLRYSGIIHNRLMTPEGPKYARMPFRIIHLGYGLDDEAMEKKFHRTRDLLKDVLEETPTDAFAHYHFANLHRVKGSQFNVDELELLEEHAARAAQLTEPRQFYGWSTHVMSLEMLGWVNFYRKNYANAIHFASTALTYKPNYLDAMFLLGSTYLAADNPEQTIFWFDKYIKTHSKYDPSEECDYIIFHYLYRQYQAWNVIGKAAERRGDTNLAINAYAAALRERPTYKEAFESLQKFRDARLIQDIEWSKYENLYEGEHRGEVEQDIRQEGSATRSDVHSR
jgi:glycosyltransferase involved in cell wall biosynthesis